MKSCFGYIRVSTQKQGEGVSLEAQKDAIADFASRNDLIVSKWYEERETAAKRGRPVFAQMLKQLRNREADGVIIHKIDRSARNLRDWAMFSELPDIGVGVYVATENMDFNSRGGRLTADIQAVIAADYIRNLREECIKGINGRLKQGLFPWGAPPGYLDQGGGKPKVPCPKTAPLIRLAFELYASRQFTYETLLEELHRRGLRNKRGGKLSFCGLGNILQNPFYIGVIRIRKTGETFDGAHEPIVSTALWRQVQIVRSDRSGPKPTRHNHLFQGLFRCGLCAKPMVPELQKGRVYYRCKGKDCATKTIREDKIDAAIRQELSKLRLGALATKKAAEIEDTRLLKELRLQREALHLGIRNGEGRMERLEDLLIDGALSRASFQKKQHAIQIKLKQLHEELEKTPDPEALRLEQGEMAELQNNLVFLYDLANRGEKRILVENVWPNRYVRAKKLEFEPYSWIVKAKSNLPFLGGAQDRGPGRTHPWLSAEEKTHTEPLQKLLHRYRPDR